MTQVYHAETNQGGRAKGYIDEVISERLSLTRGVGLWPRLLRRPTLRVTACQGRVYVHQDANWNVTALTDLTGRVLERNWYSPYGEVEVVHEAHPFDFDP